MSWSYSDLLDANWSSVPGDIIDSIVPYLPARDVIKLCLYNDTFNRRVCQNRDSIVWKLLYQRDISENVPTNHIASRYLDIMDEILPLTPNKRLLYGAKNGYDGIVKSALQNPSGREPSRADINANYDEALREAAVHGHTEIVKLLLDRGADIHALCDQALLFAAYVGHTDTVKLLLRRGARLIPAHMRIIYSRRNPEILALFN